MTSLLRRRRNARLGHALWLLCLAAALPARTAPQAYHDEPLLGLRYVLPSGAAAPARPTTTPAQDRLSRGIEAAGTIGFIEHGVQASKEALIECQKGDYPGGGMGLMSMPLARPNAVTDHCRRF
jgi:hypothetical protein